MEISWRRLEAGLYRLCADGEPTCVCVYSQMAETRTGKPKLWSWASGIIEDDGHVVGDGTIECDTLKKIKEAVARRYAEGRGKNV